MHSWPTLIRQCASALALLFILHMADRISAGIAAVSMGEIQ